MDYIYKATAFLGRATALGSAVILTLVIIGLVIYYAVRNNKLKGRAKATVIDINIISYTIDQKKYTVNISVDKRVGEIVDISYDPKHPTTVIIGEPKYPTLALIILAFYGFMLGIFFVDLKI